MLNNMKEFEFEIIIRENLKPIEDVELVLLKGHLVIEQLITELLELNLTDPSRLNTINPMFSKKLEIYLAIDGNSLISKGLEKILKELNSLRNKLAHNLKHPNFDQLLKDWVQRASRTKIDNPEDISEIRLKLIDAISQISAFLTGLVEAHKACNNRIQADQKSRA